MRLIDRIRPYAQRIVGITDYRIGRIEGEIAKVEERVGKVRERLRLLDRPWEDLISLRSFESLDFEVLASAADLRDASGGELAGVDATEIAAALATIVG